MDDTILLNHVRAVLSITPARWQGLTSTFPTDLLSRQPLAGEWSAAECLRHLLETERHVFPVRARAFLEGKDFTPFDPRAQDSRETSQEPAQLAAEFASLRAESLHLLGQITPADFSRTARHPQFGQVTLREMLHTWASHDLMHTVQAERALMQPFIAGAGPWQSFFVDHIAKAKEA